MFSSVLYCTLPCPSDSWIGGGYPLYGKGFFDLDEDLDRVALIDDGGEESIALRLDLIAGGAEKTLEISYHSLHKGVVAELFLRSHLRGG